MASDKAARPSGIVAEMLKPVGEAGAEEVRDLVENIISEGCIPTDQQESFIVNIIKKFSIERTTQKNWRNHLCVYSLSASIKRTRSTTTEKNGDINFSRFRSANSVVSCRIWRKLKLIKICMLILFTCKNEEDPIKMKLLEWPQHLFKYTYTNIHVVNVVLSFVYFCNSNHS